MKTGADKDPIVKKIMEEAQKVVDKATELYPNELEEKETEVNFPQK